MTGPQSTSHPLALTVPAAPDVAPPAPAGLFGAALTSCLDDGGGGPADPQAADPSDAPSAGHSRLPGHAPYDVLTTVVHTTPAAGPPPQPSPDADMPVAPPGGPLPGLAPDADVPLTSPSGVAAPSPAAASRAEQAAVEVVSPPGDHLTDAAPPPTGGTPGRPSQPPTADPTPPTPSHPADETPPAPSPGDPVADARQQPTTPAPGRSTSPAPRGSRTADDAQRASGGQGVDTEVDAAAAADRTGDLRTPDPAAEAPDPGRPHAGDRPAHQAAAGIDVRGRSNAGPGTSAGPTTDDGDAARTTDAQAQPVGGTRRAGSGEHDAAHVEGAAEAPAPDLAEGTADGPAPEATDRSRAAEAYRRTGSADAAAPATSPTGPEDGAAAGADDAAPAPADAQPPAAAPPRRVPAEPIVQRIVALVERLRAEPPPRQMVIDLESLGAGRLVVSLRGDTVVVGPVSGGTPLDQQWLQDLDEALDARGWSFDHRQQQSSPHDRRPREPLQRWRIPRQPDHARAADGLRL